MRNYIEDYKALLNETDRQVLEGFLNVDAKAVTSETSQAAEQQLEEKIRELMSQLGQDKMVMELRLQEEGSQTDSLKYNLNLQEAILDLKTLYAESNRIDALLANHSQLNRAILTNLEKDIQRLRTRIDMLNLLADNNEGYGTANRENFNDNGLTETDRNNFGHLFVDRDGIEIPEIMNCQIDPMEGALKLGTSESYDRIHTAIGDTVATIEIIEQTGEGFSDKDPNHGIDKALDGRMDTFWGEVLLSDGVMKVPVPASENSNITSGAICKFKITFPNPVTVSQFSFKPYCEFPIEICYVGYSKSDDTSIGPDGGYCIPYNPDKPILVDKGISLDFPTVTAKCLIVMIRQSTATKNFYTVTADQRNNREMWSKIAAAERKLTLDTVWRDDNPATINPTLSQDKVEEFDVRWQQYLTAQKEWNERWMRYRQGAFSGFVTEVVRSTNDPHIQAGTYSNLWWSFWKPPEMPQRIRVEKYEYIYGAYEMGVRGQEYYPRGIYVSKPHTVNGNVQTVVLEANEWHPQFLASDGSQAFKKKYNDKGVLVSTGDPLRRTSVEYYISPRESGSSWIPILPITETRVNNELLIFENRSIPRARTRFPIDQDNHEVIIYKDEMPLASYEWNYVNNDYQTIEISPSRWDPESYYTIDYYPDKNVYNPYEIDFTPGKGFTGEPVSITEIFNAPGGPVIDKNFAAKLSYYPYVNREAVGNRDANTGTITPRYDHIDSNPVQVTLNPANNRFVNEEIHKIIGHQKLITGPIKSYRDPLEATATNEQPEARLLNVTDYFGGNIPVLNLYNPTIDPQDNPIPTFEYYHDGKKVVFTETFRHDGPVENYGASNGNAIVAITYKYSVSGVR